MNTRYHDRSLDSEAALITADEDGYPLGYSEAEFRRLQVQGAIAHDLTLDVLRQAGIRPGMRVLDIGCGVGDVSLLAAELVGPSGFVLGVDRSPEALQVAERRAVKDGQCYWTRFAVAELDMFSPDEAFDALIGRLILYFLPDPPATLKRLAGYVKPGGIVAFQEMSMPGMRGVPEGPLLRQCVNWVIGTIGKAGFDPDMGGRLFATFADAGLPTPQMIAASPAGGGPHSPIYDYVAETLRSLLPTAERLGVATAAEMEVETLAERLRREALEKQACIFLPPYVGAWTSVPA
jgi:SAM-dependent methyltransferase